MDYPIISTRGFQSEVSTYRGNAKRPAYCFFEICFCPFHVENSLKSLVSTNSTIAACGQLNKSGTKVRDFVDIREDR